MAMQSASGRCRVGWRVGEGEARSTESVHPSERALWLAGGTTIDGTRFATSNVPTRIRLIASCESGTYLRVSLVSTVLADGGSSSPSWDLTGTEGNVLQGYERRVEWSGGRVRWIQLETIGSGSCVVDEVLLTAVTTC